MPSRLPNRAPVRADDAANRAFARHMMGLALLTPEREQTLARRWRRDRDEAALHGIVLAYGRLVLGHAARFRRFGLPVEDLVQEGNLALLLAADRFEPDRGVRFSTYAQWWIRAAMQEYVLRNWSIVRTGTTTMQKSLFFKLRSIRARIDQSGGARDPAVERERLATQLGIDVAEVESMEVVLAGRDRSINEPAKDGERERQETIADSRPLPEDVVAHAEIERLAHRSIEQALAGLSERERRIVVARRLRENGETLDSLGRDLGISKERVRQLEKRALGKLHTVLTATIRDAKDVLFAG
ncbi:MAG: RNA polymerase factor sigma-32 [Alphaproteobacteria bacterium]|nr:RNA polymerase factor sigma-32 [Alphaproteobacteria bacterium]